MSGEPDSSGRGEGGQKAQRGAQETVQQQPSGEQPSVDSDGSPEADAAKFGLLVYALVGLGVFVTQAITLLLADDESVVWFTGDDLGVAGFQDEELFVAAASAYDLFFLLAPVVAVVIGVYYFNSEAAVEPPKAAAIAVGAGVIAIGLVLIVLLVIFEPSLEELTGFETSEEIISFGDEIPGLLGLTIGSVIVGAVTAVVLDHDAIDFV